MPVEQNNNQTSIFWDRAAKAALGAAAVGSVVAPFVISSAAGVAAMSGVNSFCGVSSTFRGLVAVHAGAQAVNTTNLLGSLGGYRLAVGVASSAIGVGYASVRGVYDHLAGADETEALEEAAVDVEPTQ